MEEWERSHSGKKKGETKKERKVSFNQRVCGDEKYSSKSVVASQTDEMKMKSKDDIETEIVKYHKINRSKTESCLQSLNSVQSTNSSDRKYASIDVLYLI